MALGKRVRTGGGLVQRINGGELRTLEITGGGRFPVYLPRLTTLRVYSMGRLHLARLLAGTPNLLHLGMDSTTFWHTWKHLTDPALCPLLIGLKISGGRVRPGHLRRVMASRKLTSLRVNVTKPLAWDDDPGPWDGLQHLSIGRTCSGLSTALHPGGSLRGRLHALEMRMDDSMEEFTAVAEALLDVRAAPRLQYLRVFCSVEDEDEERSVLQTFQQICKSRAGWTMRARSFGLNLIRMEAGALVEHFVRHFVRGRRPSRRAPPPPDARG
jgi:hypothetical protein